MSQTKVCGRCDQKKSPVEFYRMVAAKDGLQPLCKTCDGERRRGATAKRRVEVATKVCSKCRHEKVASEFHKKKLTPSGLNEWCKTCVLSGCKHRRKADIEGYRAKGRAEWKTPQRLSRYYQRKYGITWERYQEMLSEQGGGCFVCRAIPPSGVKLHVDHDHRTGKVRRLLCSGCNGALSRVDDDPARLSSLAAYVQSYRTERWIIARDENMPFPLGSTYFGGDTTAIDLTVGTNLEGQEYLVEDDDLSTGTQGANVSRSGRKRRVRIVRNMNAVTLGRVSVAKLKLNGTAPGHYIGRVDGLCASVADKGYPVDEYLGPTGCLQYDLCYIVIDGLAKVQTDTAGTTTLAIGQGVISGSTTPGRVIAQDPTATGAALFNQVQNCLGVAAAVVAGVSTEFVIDVGATDR